jgi:hypothetical protein
VSREFHEQANVALRTAMADLFDFGDGWTLLGCFSDGSTLGWKALPEFTQAVTDASSRLIGERGLPLPPVLTAGYEDPPRDQMQGLHGIAEVHYGSDGKGRFGFAKAVFADSWRHSATWRADEAAPEWTLHSPPEIAGSGLDSDLLLPGLLAGLLYNLGLEHRLVSEEQRALSTALRDLIAACTESGSNALFVVTRRSDRWEAIPANDLSVRVGAKVEEGMNVIDAVGELAAEFAAEFAADPSVTIPSLRGVGTIIHFDNDDGSVDARLFAVCDQALHAASWIGGRDRPDWQILPIDSGTGAAALDYESMVAAYTQLLHAVRGDRP